MVSWGPEYERKRIGKKEREDLFARQKSKCMYCGFRSKEISRFEVDHKIPIAKNGRNRFSNYQLLCGPCNKRKGKMTDGEFRRKYKLTPARQVKGPPLKRIPLSHFDNLTKTAAKKRLKKKREDDWWGF
jgi:5-methylcytosine-specific restriction endonuclease McrA